MCYLIAKKRNERGCMAVEAERDKALAALVTYLGQRTLGKGIQILTVNDMDVYGEYKPYEIIPSEREFVSRVLAM